VAVIDPFVTLSVFSLLSKSHGLNVITAFTCGPALTRMTTTVSTVCCTDCIRFPFAQREAMTWHRAFPGLLPQWCCVHLPEGGWAYPAVSLRGTSYGVFIHWSTHVSAVLRHARKAKRSVIRAGCAQLRRALLAVWQACEV
jgi:hypothetical protein